MLHGLTGDSDMMMEFATKICPENCNLIVPDAPFKHEKRGYCWWEYSEGVVNEKTRSEIQHSIQFLERVIPKEGKIIIGGFSQGAAMAQIMLLSEIRERISGMILLGTRGINDVHLREGLRSIDPVPVLWMHGKRDEIIPFNEAINLPETMLEENWKVKQIVHERGHAIPSGHHATVTNFVREIYLHNT